MKQFILSTESGTLIIKKADTFGKRFLGLLGTASLADDTGLLIDPCNSVHMFWMRYALDIVYLDKENRIIKIVVGLKPWRVSMCLKARKTLELADGTAKRLNLRQGDQFTFASEQK